MEQKKDVGAMLRRIVKAALLWAAAALILLLGFALLLSLSDVKSSSYSAFSLAIGFIAALFAGRGAVSEGRIGIGTALLLGAVFGLLPGLIGWIAGGASFSWQQATGVFALTVLGVLLGSRLVGGRKAGRSFHASVRRKHAMN